MNGWRVLPLMICLFTGLLTSDARAAAPAPPVPLQSVLRREQDVFASSPAGLFRASLADKTWQRLALPPSMPVDGAFAAEPSAAKTIWYYTPLRAAKLAAGKKRGLYRSSDDGLTWHLVSSQFVFHDVFLHDNGKLFALAAPIGNPLRTFLPSLVLMSEDEGKHWRSIGGKFCGFFDIFADPDHPNLICVLVAGIRGYVLQAEDESYQWKETREVEWRRERPLTEDAFFSTSYSAGNFLYLFPATLSNYFAYDFSNRAGLPGFDLKSAQNAFVFGPRDAVVIPITVRFLPKKAMVALLDTIDGQGLWGLKIVDPDAKQVVVPAPASALALASKNWDRSSATYRDKHAIKSVILDAAHPYLRDVDLSKLYAFTRPGTYKMQIVYDNTGAAYHRPTEWQGRFSSSAFTVTVRAEDGKQENAGTSQ